MMTGKVEFRMAGADDAAGISRVLEVFSPDPRTPQQVQEQVQHIQQTAQQWRIGVCGSEVVSAARAAPAEVWFGKSLIKWADVGEVSVLSSLQGQGIGSLAMSDIVRRMRQDDIGVSRLGGLLRFYRRFGYEPFPRCYVEFPLTDFIRAGVSRLPFADVLAPAFPETGQVRAFDAQRDLPRTWQVIESFTRHRTGCRAWQPPQDVPANMRHALIYESAGQVRGVMRHREYETDISSSEASVTIYGLFYDLSCPAALDALIKHTLKRAHQRKATRVTAYLPMNEDVVAHLQRLGLTYTLCETMGAVAGNMIQIINLRAMLEQMQPELQRRLADMSWSGNITLDLGDQQASLEIVAGQVGVREAGGDTIKLRLSHAEWLRAVLGVLPSPWHRLLTPCDAAWSVLHALFSSSRGGYTT
ncbi:MAG TPA: GNAT family N-acetyltransferase [Abditibacteriaceae bacterium]|nr:GNAT family N-acetyltransferase [Abditibacteriaceae bacterium]